MHKQLNVHQKPRGLKEWTLEQKKELFSYHNKGYDFKEVAEMMGVSPATRVRNKANSMHISLVKGVVK